MLPFDPNPLPPPAPTPAITALQRYAMFGVAVVFVGMVALVVAALITHHDLSDPILVQLFGFGITILVAMAGFAGLGAAVQNVHLSVNSRLDQLVTTTRSDAYQQGQTAGAAAASAVVPPAAGDAQQPS